MKTETALILGAVGLVVLYFTGRNAGTIATGAANAFVDATEGIGAAINDRIINPAVQGITGEKDATLGGWIWDLLHPTDAYYLKNGLPLDPAPGALTPETDPYQYG